VPSEGLSCADCPNPIVAGFVNGVYTLTVSSFRQQSNVVCTGTAQMFVNVGRHDPVYIPNAFSPNGNNINDRFFVYGRHIREIRLKIFNRWGEKIYDSSNPFEGWDGTFKGQPQPAAVYTYVAEIIFLNNKETVKQGSITLIR
jgi:gliding motility-associated-like protein